MEGSAERSLARAHGGGAVDDVVGVGVDVADMGFDGADDVRGEAVGLEQLVGADLGEAIQYGREVGFRTGRQLDEGQVLLGLNLLLVPGV